jgi:hypothetical protein
MTVNISFYQSLWLMFHMIGIMLIGTVLIGSLIAERQMRLATDWSQRARVGMLSKNIGMIAPIASLTLLASGIGNMATFGFTLSQAFGVAATWLGVKIVVFFIAVINGTVFSMRMGKKRQGIIMGVKNGGSSEAGEAALKATFGMMNIFFTVQALFILTILTMVLFKPV